MARVKIIWTLIKYNKFQMGSPKKGLIVMKGKNADGFLEKIFKLGFEEYVYSIQCEEKGDISYSVNIGSFEEEKANNIMNKDIVESAKNLLPLLDLLKKSDDGYHTKYIRLKQDNVRMKTILDRKPPTYEEFKEYYLLMNGKVSSKAVEKEIKKLFDYYNFKKWKINNRPMKDWKVEAFKNHFSEKIKK